MTTEQKERDAVEVVASALPKIFVFVNGQNSLGLMGCAIAEDGKVLAGHCSSSVGWLRHDMGVTENGWKRDLYAAHYPHGYEVVDLLYVDPTTNAGFVAALAIANAAESAPAKGAVEGSSSTGEAET